MRFLPIAGTELRVGSAGGSGGEPENGDERSPLLQRPGERSALPTPAEHRGAGTDPPSPLPGHREARRGHCPLLIAVKGCLDA